MEATPAEDLCENVARGGNTLACRAPNTDGKGLLHGTSPSGNQRGRDFRISNLPVARDRLYLPGLIRAVKTAFDRAGRTQARFSRLCEKLLPNSQSYFLKRSRVYNSCLCKTTELILG